MKQTRPSCPVFLPTADLHWSDDNTPESTRFKDIYFSREDGSAESTFVFLMQNRLSERFAALADGQCFVIGETGFGTGLNFLLTVALFQAHAPAGARLIFRSVEAYPLDREQLQRALSARGLPDANAQTLLAQWPPPLPGLHTLRLGAITLQLWFGDVLDALEAWRDSNSQHYQRARSCADAWFLDGFAPSKNPDMWRDEVIGRIGVLSRPDTTLATFTVAGQVRRALTAAGFEIEKRPGFGSKREMLVARFCALPTIDDERAQTPWHVVPEPAPTLRSVIVIGAGIAGCTTAAALVRRGLAVTVVDAAVAPAQHGSGNPQAALFMPLPASDAEAGWINLHAFLYATRFYRALSGGDTNVFNPCGVLQLFGDGDGEQLEKLQQRFAGQPGFAQFVDRLQATAIAGCQVTGNGLFLPAAGWISPARACDRLLEHGDIRLLTGTRVWSIAPTDSSGRDGWLLDTSNGPLQADALVIAAAHGASALLPDMPLPIEALRGQISALAVEDFRLTPQCVVCGEGYVTPAENGLNWFGASYTRNTDDTGIRAGEHGDNLQRMTELFVGFDADLAGIRDGRAALRCASRDRLPLAGPVPAQPSFDHCYAGVSANARRFIDAPPPLRRNLYLNVGHGSRGFSTAPLVAEHLAGLICGEPPCLPWPLQQYLHPARFDIRRLRRINRSHS